MPYKLDIRGMMREDELQTIEQLAKTVPPNGVIVEVGSYCGLSAVAWSMSVDPSATVYCYDTFRESIITKEGDIINTWKEFQKNTAEFKHTIPVRGIVPEQVGYTDPRPIDVFFLDAAHSNPIDWNIIKHFLPFVRPGGIVSGHDYSSYLTSNHIGFLDVNINVHRLEEKFNKKATISQSIWYLTKP